MQCRPADLTPLLTGVTRSADGCDANMPPGVTTRRAVTDDAADTTFGVAPTAPATNVPATPPPVPAGTVATPYHTNRFTYWSTQSRGIQSQQVTCLKVSYIHSPNDHSGQCYLWFLRQTAQR